MSQSTIKMEKGYYMECNIEELKKISLSQSTIKMEKGYYRWVHNLSNTNIKSQSTIKMEKGYYQKKQKRSKSRLQGRNPQ